MLQVLHALPRAALPLHYCLPLQQEWTLGQRDKGPSLSQAGFGSTLSQMNDLLLIAPSLLSSVHHHLANHHEPQINHTEVVSPPAGWSLGPTHYLYTTKRSSNNSTVCSMSSHTTRPHCTSWAVRFIHHPVTITDYNKIKHAHLLLPTCYELCTQISGVFANFPLTPNRSGVNQHPPH